LRGNRPLIDVSAILNIEGWKEMQKQKQQFEGIPNYALRRR